MKRKREAKRKKGAKTKRVLFSESIRRECDPILFELGFRNPRRNDLNRFRGATRRNTYLRWRGTTFDNICIHWDKYNRPKCILEFQTSTVVEPSVNGQPAIRLHRSGRMITWKLNRYIGSVWIGPWRSVEGATALVKRRILQLENFFQTGETGSWIAASRERRVGFEGDGWYPYMRIEGDPWLDPESDYKPE